MNSQNTSQLKSSNKLSQLGKRKVTVAGEQQKKSNSLKLGSDCGDKDTNKSQKQYPKKVNGRQQSEIVETKKQFIDTVSENISTQKFCQDANSNKVVWARVKGYPWWPSQILSESETRKRLKAVSHRRDQTHPIIFFGTLEVAWLSEVDVSKWGEGVEQNFYQKGMTRSPKSFGKACEQVYDFLRLDKKRIAPEDWWCSAPQIKDKSIIKNQAKNEKDKKQIAKNGDKLLKDDIKKKNQDNNNIKSRPSQKGKSSQDQEHANEKHKDQLRENKIFAKQIKNKQMTVSKSTKITDQKANNFKDVNQTTNNIEVKQKTQVQQSKEDLKRVPNNPQVKSKVRLSKSHGNLADLVPRHIKISRNDSYTNEFVNEMPKFIDVKVQFDNGLLNRREYFMKVRNNNNEIHDSKTDKSSFMETQPHKNIISQNNNIQKVQYQNQDQEVQGQISKNETTYSASSSHLNQIDDQVQEVEGQKQSNSEGPKQKVSRELKSLLEPIQRDTSQSQRSTQKHLQLQQHIQNAAASVDQQNIHFTIIQNKDHNYGLPNLKDRQYRDNNDQINQYMVQKLREGVQIQRKFVVSNKGDNNLSRKKSSNLPQSNLAPHLDTNSTFGNQLTHQNIEGNQESKKQIDKVQLQRQKSQTSQNDDLQYLADTCYRQTSINLQPKNSKDIQQGGNTQNLISHNSVSPRDKKPYRTRNQRNDVNNRQHTILQEQIQQQQIQDQIINGRNAYLNKVQKEIEIDYGQDNTSRGQDIVWPEKSKSQIQAQSKRKLKEVDLKQANKPQYQAQPQNSQIQQSNISTQFQHEIQQPQLSDIVSNHNLSNQVWQDKDLEQQEQLLLQHLHQTPRQDGEIIDGYYQQQSYADQQDLSKRQKVVQDQQQWRYSQYTPQILGNDARDEITQQEQLYNLGQSLRSNQQAKSYSQAVNVDLQPIEQEGLNLSAQSQDKSERMTKRRMNSFAKAQLEKLDSAEPVFPLRGLEELQKEAFQEYEVPRHIYQIALKNYENIKRNVYLQGKQRPQRLNKNEINICNCLPPPKQDIDTEDMQNQLQTVDGNKNSDNNSQVDNDTIKNDSNMDNQAPKASLNEQFDKYGCGRMCLNRLSNVVCDQKTCPCGIMCTNKPFHLRQYPKMELSLTKNCGIGVKALELIKKGQFVAEYVGEVVDEQSLESRMEVSKQQGLQHYYVMELGQGLYIDARYKGSIARNFNSSCQPNCETSKWRDAATGELHVVISAIKDIQPGDQICYNYMFQHYGPGQLSQCRCGAPNCVGLLQAPRQPSTQEVKQVTNQKIRPNKSRKSVEAIQRALEQGDLNALTKAQKRQLERMSQKQGRQQEKDIIDIQLREQQTPVEDRHIGAQIQDQLQPQDINSTHIIDDELKRLYLVGDGQQVVDKDTFRANLEYNLQNQRQEQTDESQRHGQLLIHNLVKDQNQIKDIVPPSLFSRHDSNLFYSTDSLKSENIQYQAQRQFMNSLNEDVIGIQNFNNSSTSTSVQEQSNLRKNNDKQVKLFDKVWDYYKEKAQQYQEKNHNLANGAFKPIQEQVFTKFNQSSVQSNSRQRFQNFFKYLQAQQSFFSYDSGITRQLNGDTSEPQAEKVKHNQQQQTWNPNLTQRGSAKTQTGYPNLQQLVQMYNQQEMAQERLITPDNPHINIPNNNNSQIDNDSNNMYQKNDQFTTINSNTNMQNPFPPSFIHKEKINPEFTSQPTNRAPSAAQEFDLIQHPILQKFRKQSVQPNQYLRLQNRPSQQQLGSARGTSNSAFQPQRTSQEPKTSRDQYQEWYFNQYLNSMKVQQPTSNAMPNISRPKSQPHIQQQPQQTSQQQGPQASMKQQQFAQQIQALANDIASKSPSNQSSYDYVLSLTKVYQSLINNKQNTSHDNNVNQYQQKFMPPTSYGQQSKNNYQRGETSQVNHGNNDTLPQIESSSTQQYFQMLQKLMQQQQEAGSSNMSNTFKQVLESPSRRQQDLNMVPNFRYRGRNDKYPINQDTQDQS